MQVDAATVDAVTILVFALTAAFLGWTWFAQRSSDALPWWSAAFLLAAASAVLTWAEGGKSRLVLLADDYALVLAHLLLWSGFRAFNGRPPPAFPGALALGLYTLALLALGLPAREFLEVAVLLSVAVTAAAAVEFARETERELSWKRLALAIMGLHAAFLTARLFLPPAVPGPGAAPLLEGVRLLFLLEPLLLTVALGLTLIGMVSERRGAAHAAAARSDPLTATLNRRGYEAWIEREGVRTGAFADRPLAAIFLDIDHFKRVNDGHGHAVGDEVLGAFARTACASLRKEDVLVRFGGEEFLALLKGADAQTAAAVARRIREAVRAAPVETAAGPVVVTASFGVAALPGLRRPSDLERLLGAADAALYAAKRAGRDRIVVAGAAGAGVPAALPGADGELGDAPVGRRPG